MRCAAALLAALALALAPPRASALLVTLYGDAACVNTSDTFGPVWSSICSQLPTGQAVALTSCSGSPASSATVSAFLDGQCTGSPLQSVVVSSSTCVPFDLLGSTVPVYARIAAGGGDAGACTPGRDFYTLGVHAGDARCANQAETVTIDGGACAVNGLPSSISTFIPGLGSNNLYTTVVKGLGGDYTICMYTAPSCGLCTPATGGVQRFTFASLGACLGVPPILNLAGIVLGAAAPFPAIVSATPTPSQSPTGTPTAAVVSPMPSVEVKSSTPTAAAGGAAAVGSGAAARPLENAVTALVVVIVLIAVAVAVWLVFFKNGGRNARGGRTKLFAGAGTPPPTPLGLDERPTLRSMQAQQPQQQQMQQQQMQQQQLQQQPVLSQADMSAAFAEFMAMRAQAPGGAGMAAQQQPPPQQQPQQQRAFVPEPVLTSDQAMRSVIGMPVGSTTNSGGGGGSKQSFYPQQMQ